MWIREQRTVGDKRQARGADYLCPDLAQLVSTTVDETCRSSGGAHTAARICYEERTSMVRSRRMALPMSLCTNAFEFGASAGQPGAHRARARIAWPTPSTAGCPITPWDAREPPVHPDSRVAARRAGRPGPAA